MKKTLEMITSESDSSELFSRAEKLLKLSEGFKDNESDVSIALPYTEAKITREHIYHENINVSNKHIETILRPYNPEPNPRYYRPEVFGGYMLCNDWYPNRRNNSQYKLFRRWLLSLADSDNIVA